MATSIPSSVSKLTWTVLLKLHDDVETTTSIFFSPLSVTIALGILAGGATEQVKASLMEKLGVSSMDQLQSIVNLIASKQSHASATLSVANAVFTDETIELFSAYKAVLEGFGAESFQYPNLAEEVDTINSWISDKTDNLIQRMLSKANLKFAHLVIVNALAFKGKWEVQFDKNATISKPFYITTERQKLVPMMNMQKKKIWVRQNSFYEAVRLPYASPHQPSSGGISLVAYLPRKDVSIKRLIEAIGSETSLPLHKAFSPVKYDHLGIPKFKILGSYSLMETLTKLGFPLEESFPEMGTGPSIVQDVLHKAFVKVDENGTTAAAATVITMTRSRPLNLKALVFERPFVFTISMDDSAAVLFAGVYYGD